MTTLERQALVLDNQKLVTRLVESVMRRHSLPEEWREELSAIGTLGLVQAAASFDPARGVAFAGFASHRVSGAVIDSLRRGKACMEVLQGSFDGERSPSPSPERRLITTQDMQRVHEAMMSLDVRERELIETLYGERPSLSAVAEQQGISKSWASRLRDRAVESMRDNSGPERAAVLAPTAKREVLHDEIKDVGQERTSRTKSRSM